MGQKKEHSNFIKEHLKKRDFTQTWLAKEFGMNFMATKLLQKSEMRKDIVIELSYKGFSCASDYS